MVQGQLLQQREQSLEMKKNPWEMIHPQVNLQGTSLAEKNQAKSLAGKNRERSPEETIHQVMSRLPEMLESQSHWMALYRPESERQEPVLGR